MTKLSIADKLGIGALGLAILLLRSIAAIGMIVMLAWMVTSVTTQKPESEIPAEPPYEQSEQIGFAEGENRSSLWSKIRDEFVMDHPVCAACNTKTALNVHHIIPFSVRPDLELDKANLITLCREHHFRIGHDPDGPWKPAKPAWTRYNPNVRAHAAKQLELLGNPIPALPEER